MNFSRAPSCDSSCGRNKPRCLLVLLVLLDAALGVCALRYVGWSNIDADEVEHSHVTWCTSQGVMPYRDIHQIHMPLLWITCGPIVGAMPKSVESVIVLRVLCLFAFLGVYGIGLGILREILGPGDLLRSLAMLLLCLSSLPAFESYRFRPDPFMVLCAAMAIWAAVRLGRSPLCYAMASGVALGLAASFSTKMASLCLLVPSLCVFECFRRRSARPLWLTIPHGLGFIAGVLPALAWLFHNNLFDSFVYWTMSVNSHTVNLTFAKTLDIAENSDVWLAWALFGGAAVAFFMPGALKKSWSPAAALLAAVPLTWPIAMITPNHMTYNLQAFAMPAAALGTLLIVKLTEPADSPLRRLALIAVLLLPTAWEPIRCGVHLTAPGNTIRISDLRELVKLGRANDVCVCLAPWHPIFCRDASDVYLDWDIRVFEVDWTSATVRRPYWKMWQQTVDVVETRRPPLILDREIWRRLLDCKTITSRQYDRVAQVLKTDYDRGKAGGITVFVRKRPDGLPKKEIRPEPARK